MLNCFTPYLLCGPCVFGIQVARLGFGVWGLDLWKGVCSNPSIGEGGKARFLFWHKEEKGTSSCPANRTLILVYINLFKNWDVDAASFFQHPIPLPDN